MKRYDSLQQHLLSHRLRGFDTRESTVLGLKNGLLAGACNAEFDVRMTRDGHPIAFHDPFFKADDGTWRYVDESDLAALRRQSALPSLATLEEMCGCFAEYRTPDALLHVDVKTSGQESVIYLTIAKFDLLAHVVLVSWLPEVLVRFHELSPQTRLCFSHLSMARHRWLYPIAEMLSPLVERAAPAISWALGGVKPQLARETLAVRLQFHDNGDPAAEPEAGDETRLTPGHVVPDLLKGTMLELLRSTAGIACVPLGLASRELGKAYRAQNIQLAVYSVKDMPTLNRVMAEIDPDIVYVDNADIIRAVASRQRTQG